MRVFWSHANKIHSYEDLLADLNSLSSVPSMISSEDTYHNWLHLLASILTDQTVSLIDPGTSQRELETLDASNNSSAPVCMWPVKLQIRSAEDLLSQLLVRRDKAHIQLFTSGTTGRPKKVNHTVASLTRNVKVSERHQSAAWAFAYNPLHISGLQVFFQALLNLNPMHYVFGEGSTEIYKKMKQWQVSRISATPSFYRSHFLGIREVFPSVSTVASGGERFDESLMSSLKAVFPNARLINIYASSEVGTLLTAKDNVFSIPPAFASAVRIAEDGELLVHKNLIQFESELDEGQWYRTGDMVEQRPDGSFTFAGRKKSFVNVGGYKVNLEEVEQTILGVEGVRLAGVYARNSSVLGSIIAARVVKSEQSLGDDELRKRIDTKLKLELQKWKWPRIIEFTDALEMTHTGKHL
jgi:acyl-coenzyme A synthetase/AMP-(fatty) acid ligase